MIELSRLEHDGSWLLIGRFTRLEIFENYGRTCFQFDGVPTCDLRKIASLSAASQFKIYFEGGPAFVVDLVGIWQETGRSSTDERDLREMGFMLWDPRSQSIVGQRLDI